MESLIECSKCENLYDFDTRPPIYHTLCKKCICIECWCKHLSSNTLCLFCNTLVTYYNLIRARSQHNLENANYLGELISANNIFSEDFFYCRIALKNQITIFCHIHSLLFVYYDPLYDNSYCKNCKTSNNKPYIVDYHKFLIRKRTSISTLRTKLNWIKKDKVDTYMNSKINDKIDNLIAKFKHNSRQSIGMMQINSVIDREKASIIYKNLDTLINYLQELNTKIFLDFVYLEGEIAKLDSLFKSDATKLRDIMDCHNLGQESEQPYMEVNLSGKTIYDIKQLFEKFYMSRTYIQDCNQNLGRNMINTLLDIVWQATKETHVINALARMMEKDRYKLENVEYSWQWLNSRVFKDNSHKKSANIISMY